MTGRFDGTGRVLPAAAARPPAGRAPAGWSGAPQGPPGPPPGWSGPPQGPPPGWSGPPGWPGPAVTRTPSGLFPSKPPRPTWREPHPIRPLMVLAGAGAGTAWMVLFGVLASTARGYVWLTVAGAVIAWLAALGLLRFGDRGVASGVGLAAGAGLAVAGIVVTVSWVYGNWLLW